MSVDAVVDRPFSGSGAGAKRLDDVTVGLLALLFLAPLLIVIAILVRIDSPGPLIFRQERVGLGNRRFFVLKFRTMRCDPSPDPLVPQAKRGDPRITRVGAILRRLSLDELPQLFNVLRGEMSLVGPRPHAAAHDETYAPLIDGYLARYCVKPGITGWAQVHGERGRTDTVQDMQRRLEYDLYYIANWSSYFDLKIMLMTIPAIMLGINAY
jgi:exopolysaccharide biosynthesis polyprenyl glycosylphosphotransferase